MAKTMSMIHPDLIDRYIQAAGIPHAKANEDGTINFPAEGEDWQQMMRALWGLVLAIGAVKTAVVPSNLQRVKEARDLLEELRANKSQFLISEGYGEAIVECIDGLDSAMDNLSNMLNH